MRTEVRAALRTLLPEGGMLTCAVSGGADSVALLHCLAGLQAECHFRLRAAHFNHCLRGAESERDEAFVRALCDRLGVALTVGRGDVAAQCARSDDSVEEAARHLRYAFLEQLPGAVATAHTADDNLETLLINLVRGTSLAGLCGIPPRRGKFIRPLLGCSRAQVEAYLQQHGLAHVEDSSNASDGYLRNRLRHGAAPLLKAENPALLRAVTELTGRLRQDEQFLDSLARAALQQARSGEDAWDCALLAAQPEPVLHRAALLLLDGIPDRTARHVQALCALIRSPKPSAQLSLPGGRVARREYALLRFGEGGCVPIPLTELRIPGCTPAGRWLILCERSRTRQPGTLAIPCPPGLRLWVRSRQSGDTLRLPGGSRSVKKLLIDRKIPAHRRDEIPVLCDAHGPLALLGVAADCVQSHAEAPAYLTISYKERID